MQQTIPGPNRHVSQSGIRLEWERLTPVATDTPSWRPIPDQRPRSFGNTTALVIHTRDYGTADLWPALARFGFSSTDCGGDGETGRLLVQLNPALVVLAIDPECATDLALVQSVSHLSQAPLLVLARGPRRNGLAAALRAGADVAITEADGLDIVQAQIGAFARRKSPRLEVRPSTPSTLAIRDLVIDFNRCRVTRGEEIIPLTPTEFRILAFLARNAGKVATPVDILRAAQDCTYSEREAQEILKVHILRIRRKMEADPLEPSYILNVRGFGYMIERQRHPGAASQTPAA